MRRREFIAGLGASAWPVMASAQQQEPMRRIGILMSLEESEPEGQARIKAFLQGLRALGWIEGRNLKIDYRWGGGSVDRIRTYAAELVQLAPEVIVATAVVDALHAATTSIPVVFVLANDPIGHGHIASYARPGGDITGFTFLEVSLIGKVAGASQADCAGHAARGITVQSGFDFLSRGISPLVRAYATCGRHNASEGAGARFGRD
jgi:putative tryptophan/tyrosine transport system substrate-binding protein